MSAGLRRLVFWIVALCLASAVPAFISPARGLAVSAIIAVAGGLALSRYVGARYVEPIERVACAVGPHLGAPDASPGDIARMVAFQFRDVVANFESEVASGRRREAALRHSGDGIVLIDGDGLVEYANPAARTMLHERVLDLSRRLLSPDLVRVVALARELGTLVQEEVVVRTPRSKPVLAQAVPTAPDGVVLLLQDLSESYRLDRVRRDFVANVSHELKTPVASLRALADVVATAQSDGDLDAAASFVTRIGAEADRLSRLVSDLLDLSAAEAGHTLDPQPVDLLDLARTAADRASTIAAVKAVPIVVSGPNAVVDADPTQLAMAVQNLVDNAVRYSDKGTVRLTVGVADDRAHIAVSDDGIGIPDKELVRIFERFYRVDRARSRATGGTGLGLSIVRHVAENHGGGVDVQSDLGVGSIFTLWLPAKRAAVQGSAA